MRILIGFMLIALSKKFDLEMPFVVGLIGILTCIIVDLKEAFTSRHVHSGTTNIYMPDKYDKNSLSETQAENVQKTVGQ